jgi:hypothetical protein
MNDEQLTEQPGPPVPAGQEPPEASRSWPSVVTELAHKVADGTVSGAAGYGTKMILDKVRRGGKPGDGGGEPAPPDTSQGADGA